MRFIRDLGAALPLLGFSLETWGGGGDMSHTFHFIYIGDDNPTVAVAMRRPKISASAAQG